MPYKWKLRRGLNRSRVLSALPTPLIVASLLVSVLAWVIMSSDSTILGAPTTTTEAAAPQEAPLMRTVEKSPGEVTGLRQEVSDLGVAVQQQTLVSMAASDEIQSLQSQLVTAQKKFLAANTERDAAVSQAAELRAELQRNAHHLEAVCEALRSAPGIPQTHRDAMAVLSACPIPANQ